MSAANPPEKEEPFPPSLKAIAPFQVTFLIWIGVLALDFASTKAVLGGGFGYLADPVRLLMFHGGQFAIVAILIAVLPTFRTALPTLFARPRFPMEPDFLVTALCLALCWAVGLHAMLVLFPSILVWPSLAAGFWKFFPNSLELSFAQYGITFVALCLFAPIVEEILNRGLLLGALKERFGQGRAVIISSLIFGAFHYKSFAITAVVGAIYALVAIRYRSLLPSILLHAIYNTIAIMPLFNNTFLAKDPVTATDISNWIPEVVMATLSIPLGILFVRYLRKPPA